MTAAKKAKTKHKDIGHEVLQQIETGKINMRPRSYFVLLSVVSGLAIAFSTVFAAYLVNLVWLRLEIDEGEMLGPGLQHHYELALRNIPWAILILAIASGLLAAWLMRKRVQFGHRLPGWTLGVGLVVFLTVVGLLLSRSSFNRHAQDLPPFSPLYNHELRDKLRHRELHRQPPPVFESSAQKSL